MKTKDKIVVTFVWGIIVFETTCFLSIMAPLLYQNVQNYLLKNLPAFIMFIKIVTPDPIGKNKFEVFYYLPSLCNSKILYDNRLDC